MVVTMSSRRSFLKGKFDADGQYAIPPPGTTPEFTDMCTKCSDCAKACPEGIIVREKDGSPVVDFNRGACTFCGECAEACTTGALSPARMGEWPWKAWVGERCLSVQGITCRACEDACDARAIRFRLALGGRSRPLIDLDRCTGCGGCSHSCPVQAITLEKHDPHPRRED